MSELIDESHLEMMGGRESDDLRLILDDFLESVDSRAEVLRKGMEADAREEVRDEAHGLKGSANMCGFLAIGEHAAELERKAKNGEPFPEAGAWVDRLKELEAATRTALGA
ncbi:MAG: Hpt domain-containing protein [Verrucomicrobiota bacterium JB023]|nr:Hpt domain-containing protein [Verrucomicrobiota bacterium JB023]